MLCVVRRFFLVFCFLSIQGLPRWDLSSKFWAFSFNSLCFLRITSTYAMRSIFCCFIELSISINLLLLVSSNIWILWFNSPMSFRFSFILSFILMMPPPSLSSICVWALYQKQPPVVVCKKWCSSKFRKIHRKIPVPESRF